ncbi:YopT-type cysteine protease domain-containing protein [Paraburkholderia jirisanensis]
MKRGGVLGSLKSNSEFREYRGGDVLKATADDYVKFDQMDYRRTRNGGDGHGSCEGLVLEAMRRIDRNESSDLMDAVTYMRADANQGGSGARQLFDRVDNFQADRNSPGFRSYERSPPRYFTEQTGQPPGQRVEDLLDQLHQNLTSDGNMGVVRLGLSRIGVMEGRSAGHAILVQRNAGNGYTIFDPNNGVFRYGSEQQMRTALRSYMNGAFAESGYTAAPESVQFYRQRAASTRAPTAESQLPPPVLPEPSLNVFYHGDRSDL